ncbi:hypothetical protein J437_LFUL004681 [Ladona fulva]|uniref:Farnesoic acid O-methyl transferase domain-containing protein n=1 Tax=Ladona fulva TaxID=123851 RepID=A0A8K0KV01_LADFU|nr:hypothetical protein J437_LFUL004681 [Ladona fulva]
MCLVIHTQDRLEYTFFPVHKGFVQFTVTAPNDAHIALTTGPAVSNPMYEIILGGWENTKSTLRRDRQKPTRVQVYTPNLLSGTEERKFWIKCNHGHIQVGQGGHHHPFMVYIDPEPFHVHHFGICTGWGATGMWKIPGNYYFHGVT